jgi:hypothetical protein
MFYLIAGLIVFLLLSSGLRAFAQANPASLAQLLRHSGGLAALGAALLLLLRGRFEFAVGLACLGLYLLGIGSTPAWLRSGGWRRGQGGGASTRAQGVSRVRSAMIEMELDHDSGRMSGLVLAGLFEGAQLDRLTRPQCEELYRLCLADDPDGARLLEAYFDRRFAGWHGAGQGQGDTRGAEAGAARGGGAMTQDEAYEVLGLQKGASRDEVVRSHRTLMKKLHPDHGGTTDLAARVNQAKDVLLRRHP